jgi:hypothetical protein
MKRCDCAAHSAVECVCGAWDKPVAQQAEKQQPFGYLWPTWRHPEFRFTQQLRDGVEGTPVYTTPLNPLDSIKSSKTLDAQPQQAEKPKCNPHPKAPHGFDRNASHGADRHVCECESWDAYDAGIEEGMKRERALWEMADNARELGLDYEPVRAEKQEPFAYLDPGLGAFYWAREYPDGPPPGFEPVYLSPSNKRWVGLTDEDIDSMVEVTDLSGAYYYDDLYAVARAIEAKLKEKNSAT